jgi:hypothetical protein
VSGYQDELLWAALWLHRATGRDDYLRYAVDKAESFGGVGWAMTEFSWDVKYAGVQVLAAKVRTYSSCSFLITIQLGFLFKSMVCCVVIFFRERKKQRAFSSDSSSRNSVFF